ncbi:hypothetical protein HK096_003156 [Nowakowskiella sp. JEL0078]|nr:hypothetical protein HK096_003156 [Nowakowskiella sp. JEL0078]
MMLLRSLLPSGIRNTKKVDILQSAIDYIIVLKRKVEALKVNSYDNNNIELTKKFPSQLEPYRYTQPAPPASDKVQAIVIYTRSIAESAYPKNQNNVTSNDHFELQQMPSDDNRQLNFVTYQPNQPIPESNSIQNEVRIANFSSDCPIKSSQSNQLKFISPEFVQSNLNSSDNNNFRGISNQSRICLSTNEGFSTFNNQPTYTNPSSNQNHSEWHSRNYNSMPELNSMFMRTSTNENLNFGSNLLSSSYPGTYEASEFRTSRSFHDLTTRPGLPSLSTLIDIKKPF